MLARRRTATGGMAAAMAAVAAAAGAVPALAHDGRTLCVGGGDGCYRTLQAALDASRDGDTVRLRAGRFAGGATVLHSSSLVGAGAEATTIAGGGPVLTIGVEGAAAEPVVTIRGVTITGGVAHGDGITATGGGIDIPRGTDDGLGATVTIADSVISGNVAAPTRTVDSPSGAVCPYGPCRYALAAGGGIASSGSLTLRRVVVSRNVAGGVASDADGGGIASAGALVLDHVRVVGNRAVASVPDGRFAEGGGIFAVRGSLAIARSVVGGNAAELRSDLPVRVADGTLVDMSAHSGGVHVGTDVPATIVETAIVGNRVASDTPDGEGVTFASGLLALTAPFELRDSVVAGNRVEAHVATTANAGFDGTAIELDGGGHISRTRIVDNTVVVESPDVAGASNGLATFSFADDPQPALVEDTVIARNTAVARSAAGTATVQGVGVLNNAVLRLERVRIHRNVGTAYGPAGFLQGGGIWNGVLLSGPPVDLTLVDTRVTRNTLRGGDLPASGGGLFTTVPVALVRSRIARNAPDDQATGPAGKAAARAQARVHDRLARHR